MKFDGVIKISEIWDTNFILHWVHFQKGYTAGEKDCKNYTFFVITKRVELRRTECSMIKYFILFLFACMMNAIMSNLFVKHL